MKSSLFFVLISFIQVGKHLTKLFDSMAKLKLRKDDKGENTNSAYAMIAKDGEEVNFNVECLCEGQVEVWLNRLMATMRKSIRLERIGKQKHSKIWNFQILSFCIQRHYMTHAVATYEDKPRDQWLFDYPAQVSLCGTQIWWTAEVWLVLRVFSLI